jgi:hypothetical protein
MAAPTNEHLAALREAQMRVEAVAAVLAHNAMLVEEPLLDALVTLSDASLKFLEACAGEEGSQ